MRKKENGERIGTFADLRGILGRYAKSASDEQLRLWIDEARSRALDTGPVKRSRGTHRVDKDEN
jgi:hypothetical protein